MGDELHLLANRQTCLTKIAAIPQTGEPKLVAFELGGIIGFTDAIVYDESDEFGLSADKRSRHGGTGQTTLN